MLKVFISQPMRNRSNEEILQERDKIRYFLEHNFKFPIYEIPSFIRKPNSKTSLWCLGNSLECMAEADMVVFAPGWENARGCRIENMACLLYDIPVYYMEFDKEGK